VTDFNLFKTNNYKTVVFVISAIFSMNVIAKGGYQTELSLGYEKLDYDSGNKKNINMYLMGYFSEIEYDHYPYELAPLINRKSSISFSTDYKKHSFDDLDTLSGGVYSFEAAYSEKSFPLAITAIFGKGDISREGDFYDTTVTERERGLLSQFYFTDFTEVGAFYIQVKHDASIAELASGVDIYATDATQSYYGAQFQHIAELHGGKYLLFQALLGKGSYVLDSGNLSVESDIEIILMSGKFYPEKSIGIGLTLNRTKVGSDPEQYASVNISKNWDSSLKTSLELAKFSVQNEGETEKADQIKVSVAFFY